MEFTHHIPHIEQLIGYTFRDKSLLCQAFTRSSFCNEQTPHAGKEERQSNEVLEFFGDAALSVAIITDLIGRYLTRYVYGVRTKFSEGDFTLIKSHLSDKTNLSASMKKLGLADYLLLGEGDRKLGTAYQPSVMEDLFESIVGAVYIDCGMKMETVSGVVSRMLDTSWYLSEDMALASPKGELQEFCADKRRRLPPPQYESQPQRAGLFCEVCRVGERVFAPGYGKNRKAAQTEAARNALDVLRQEWEAKVVAPAPDAAHTPVALLVSYAARRGLAAPRFTQAAETSNSSARAKEYIVYATFGGRTESGVGRSKQAAKQACAQAHLVALGIPG